MLLGLPSERKEVVQPAPDLQMFVGRGQVEKDGYLFFWPSPLLEAGPLAFPVVSRGGKDFFPLGYRGRQIRQDLSRFHRPINSFSGSRGRLTLGWRAPARHIK
jgi:hypothetical protein